MGKNEGMRRFLRRGGSTIRARFMFALVLVAGIALTISGVIVGILQSRHLKDTTENQLRRVEGELRALATDGVDPETKEPFSSAPNVLKTFMRRSVISPDSGEAGFIDGELRWVAIQDVKLRPEDDPELLEAVRGNLTGTDNVIKPIRTSKGNYRVLVAVVSIGDHKATLLRVIDLDRAGAQLRQSMAFYAVAAVLTVALLIAPTWLIVGRLLRPIGELRTATDQIDEHDLTTRVPVRGRDDLTALARAVNRMLDRVQGAVEGQRRLLDDVGHELRTPITVVRGHLELIDHDDPADVIQTRELAIDELDRMGVLVNDLLTLAKASQSDFVTPTSCDVAELTDQVLVKSKALGNRDWQLENVAMVRAVLDPVRITQAWLQLAANAVKYSDEGTRIGIGSRVEDTSVLLWVRDQGIGMTPEETKAVRQRFVRTTAAVQRASGSGLGLNIVDSIVEAHGGHLDIESVPKGGSVFTLRIPMNPASPHATPIGPLPEGAPEPRGPQQ